MNQELLQASLASVNALVKDEIESSDNGRYHRAQKMCQMAQRLAAMGVGDNRVADALAMDGDAYMDENEGMAGIMRPAQMRRLGAVPDAMGLGDLFREALGAIQEQQRLQRVPRPEVLLANLLDVRERLGRNGDGAIPAALQERIDHLLVEVGRERDEPQLPQLEEPPPMVELDPATQVDPPIGGPEDIP